MAKVQRTCTVLHVKWMKICSVLSGDVESHAEMTWPAKAVTKETTQVRSKLAQCYTMPRPGMDSFRASRVWVLALRLLVMATANN